MLEITKTTVSGLSLLPNFRMSFGSMAQSDSVCIREFTCNEIAHCNLETFSIGPKDLELVSSLVLSGDSHAKILRMVLVSCFIRAPRRWWVDFDTYRVGVEKFSESTMHTIKKRALNEFDFDEYVSDETIKKINEIISRGDLIEIKSHLPEGFMQKRLVSMNYQALRHIYFDRRGHKQPEFKTFCDWINKLPYAKELITRE